MNFRCTKEKDVASSLSHVLFYFILFYFKIRFADCTVVMIPWLLSGFYVTCFSYCHRLTALSFWDRKRTVHDGRFLLSPGKKNIKQYENIIDPH